MAYQLNFIKKYAPNISNEAEDHANKTSPDFYQDYALTTTNENHIDTLIQKGSFRVKRAVASNPNIKDRHLDQLIDDENSEIRTAVASNPRAKTKHLLKAIENSQDPFDIRDMVNLPTATADVIHGIARNNHFGWYDKNDLLSSVITKKYHQITANHLDDLIGNFGGNLDRSTIKQIIGHPSATAEIQSNYLRQHPYSVDSDTIKNIIDSGKVSSDELVKFYHNDITNYNIRDAMIKHSKNPDFHEKLANSFDSENQPEDSAILAMAKHSPESAQLMLLNNKKINSKKKIWIAFRTKHAAVHQAALKFPDDDIRKFADANINFRRNV